MKYQTHPKSIIGNTAKKLSGAAKREYAAEITIELLGKSARKAESALGWSREMVKKDMMELTTGIRCVDNYSSRGNKKTEEKMPELEEAIRSIVDPESQVDPNFQTSFAYTRITAKAVRQALIDEKGYTYDCSGVINEIDPEIDQYCKILRSCERGSIQSGVRAGAVLQF
jgi:transposase